MPEYDDLKHVVQKFCPVFVYHPEERYYPCSPEWYVDKCKLDQSVSPEEVVTRKSKDAATWEAVDGLTGARGVYFGDNFKLRLADVESRTGQVDDQLSEVPMFAKIKKIKVSNETEVTTDGAEDENEEINEEEEQEHKQLELVILEINYIALYAYNGAYKILGLLEAGAHEGDWEHITVRCTPQGELIAVYYSAHRQGDGTWVPANECPFDKDTGRLLAFVAHNGHGLYPTAGVNPRVFLVANDVTSDKGRVWACQECHILEHPGKWLTKGKVELRKIPAVCDRGAVYVDAFDDSELKEYTGTIDAGDDAPVSRQYIEVSVPGTEWLNWKVRWGSVVPCFEAEWYKKAEHPTGSNPWKRTCTPWVR